MYLSWTDNGGTINGTAQYVQEKSTSSSSPVSSGSVAVTGTEAGGKITLRFGGSVLGTLMSGTIDQGHLALDSTDAAGTSTIGFEPGTHQDFTRAASVVRSAAAKAQRHAAAEAAAAAQATNEAEIDQKVSDAVTAVATQIESVKADEATLVKDKAALKALWAQQQADAPNTTATCTTEHMIDLAASDGQKVADAYTTAESDLGTFESDLADLHANVSFLGGNPPSDEAGLATASDGLSLDATAGADHSRLGKYIDAVSDKSDKLSTVVTGMDVC